MFGADGPGGEPRRGPGPNRTSLGVLVGSRRCPRSQRRSEEPQPPRGHVRIVYLGPVAPHWEVVSDFGDRNLIEEFRQRALARLLLLPPHDPQFRRNRERVVRDAERELILLDWDLGVPGGRRLRVRLTRRTHRPADCPRFGGLGI